MSVPQQPKLKISFFTSFGHPQGTYFRWHNLAIGLQKLGHRVTVHGVGLSRFGRSQTEVRDGVSYLLTPAIPYIGRLLDGRLDPITALRCLRHAPGKSDIYHVFQPFPHSCLPGLINRRRASALLFDWDDLWWGGIISAQQGVIHPSGWLPRSVKWLEHNMPRLSDGVTTCSEYLASAASQHGASNIRVIHNGYWPPESRISQTAARETLKLDPDAYYFGFMGRTLQELSWCLDSLCVKHATGRKVRLALCGMAESVFSQLPAEFRPFIDYLGNLTPDETKIFARSIDCGLLPLEDTPFNQSRFPIKFAEYLAAGAHVVASAIGEFAPLASQLPGVLLAGTTRESWQGTFLSIDFERHTPNVPAEEGSPLAQKLSWMVMARQLESFYYDRLHLTPNTVRS